MTDSEKIQEAYKSGYDAGWNSALSTKNAKSINEALLNEKLELEKVIQKKDEALNNLRENNIEKNKQIETINNKLRLLENNKQNKINEYSELIKSQNNQILNTIESQITFLSKKEVTNNGQ